MASEVEIANLALAHLGDTATVASLDPPEGSAQAEHAARFFPIARDALLESHTWNFATRRAVLAELVNDTDQWDHCYAVPSDALVIIAVLPPDVTDDLSIPPMMEALVPGGYVPVRYVSEVNAAGARVIRTDQAEASVRYTARVEDTARFTNLFTMALSWQLASMLAGPLIKGDVGAAEAKRCLQMAAAWTSRAMIVDGAQRDVKPTHSVPWMSVR